jgi:hypothetical protein
MTTWTDARRIVGREKCGVHGCKLHYRVTGPREIYRSRISGLDMSLEARDEVVKGCVHIQVRGGVKSILMRPVEFFCPRCEAADALHRY